jgi:hypothetical protein
MEGSMTTTDQQQPQAGEIEQYRDHVMAGHRWGQVCGAEHALFTIATRQAEQIERLSLRYEALWSHSQKQADLLDRKDQQIERLEKENGYLLEVAKKADALLDAWALTSKSLRFLSLLEPVNELRVAVAAYEALAALEPGQ